MYMSKASGLDRAQSQARQSETFGSTSDGILWKKQRKRDKSVKSVEVLRDIAQLWVKADENQQHWMKGFLEMLLEYSLGHIEGDAAAYDLGEKMKKFLN
jgi:hypothetical protein